MGRTTRRGRSGTRGEPVRRRWVSSPVAGRQLAVLAALIGLGSSLPGPAHAATALRVSPPIVELQAPPGGLRRFSARVSNDGPEAVTVSVHSAGVEMDLDGVPGVAPADSEWSCAPWIELERQSLELSAGESEEVRAELRIPRGVRGGRYAVVLFRTEVAGSPRGPVHLRLAASTGSVVMVTISRTDERDGQVSKLGIEPLGDGALGFTAIFENTGNVHVTMRGAVVVRDATGRIVARLPLETGTGTVLPGGARRATALWDKWGRCPDGEYAAEVQASFGGPRPARRKVGFVLSRGAEEP